MFNGICRNGNFIRDWLQREEIILSNGRKKNMLLRKTQDRWIRRSHRKCNHDVFVSKGAGDRERSGGG